MIDFFYGFCIDDTDLQEITKTEVGITKTEVADFWLLVICHKLVLKSVSYPKIVENTPILIEQSIACNVYT